MAIVRNASLRPGFVSASSPPQRVFYLAEVAGPGIYSPSAGARAIFVECLGGGGGGGGALGAASQASMGSGGGGGGGQSIYLTSLKATYNYVIGAGGAGGVGAANGANGSDTTFDSPSVCTGGGGSGGQYLAAGIAQGSASPGGAGGYSATGDFPFQGGMGGPAVRMSGTFAWSGGGGDAGGALGGGVTEGVNSGGNANGYAGRFPGGGAAGALSYNTTPQTGGAGIVGAIRITEFY